MTYRVTMTYQNTKKDVGRFVTFLEALTFDDIKNLYTSATEAEFLDVQSRILALWKDIQDPANPLAIPGIISYVIDESQLPALRISTFTFSDAAGLTQFQDWCYENSIEGAVIILPPNGTQIQIGARREQIGADIAYGANSLGEFLLFHFNVTNGGVITCVHETV